VTIIPGLLTGDEFSVGDTWGEELDEDADEELRPGDPTVIRSTAARTTLGDKDISIDILDILFCLTVLPYTMRIL
jgi:hypothetical protein